MQHGKKLIHHQYVMTSMLDYTTSDMLVASMQQYIEDPSEEDAFDDFVYVHGDEKCLAPTFAVDNSTMRITLPSMQYHVMMGQWMIRESIIPCLRAALYLMMKPSVLHQMMRHFTEKDMRLAYQADNVVWHTELQIKDKFQWLSQLINSIRPARNGRVTPLMVTTPDSLFHRQFIRAIMFMVGNRLAGIHRTNNTFRLFGAQYDELKNYDDDNDENKSLNVAHQCREMLPHMRRVVQDIVRHMQHTKQHNMQHSDGVSSDSYMDTFMSQWSAQMCTLIFRVAATMGMAHQIMPLVQNFTRKQLHYTDWREILPSSYWDAHCTPAEVDSSLDLACMLPLIENPQPRHDTLLWLRVRDRALITRWREEFDLQQMVWRMLHEREHHFVHNVSLEIVQHFINVPELMLAFTSAEALRACFWLEAGKAQCRIHIFRLMRQLSMAHMGRMDAATTYFCRDLMHRGYAEDALEILSHGVAHRPNAQRLTLAATYPQGLDRRLPFLYEELRCHPGSTYRQTVLGGTMVLFLSRAARTGRNAAVLLHRIMTELRDVDVTYRRMVVQQLAQELMTTLDYNASRTQLKALAQHPDARRYIEWERLITPAFSAQQFTLLLSLDVPQGWTISEQHMWQIIEMSDDRDLLLRDIAVRPLIERFTGTSVPLLLRTTVSALLRDTR